MRYRFLFFSLILCVITVNFAFSQTVIKYSDQINLRGNCGADIFKLISYLPIDDSHFLFSRINFKYCDGTYDPRELAIPIQKIFDAQNQIDIEECDYKMVFSEYHADIKAFKYLLKYIYKNKIVAIEYGSLKKSDKCAYYNNTLYSDHYSYFYALNSSSNNSEKYKNSKINESVVFTDLDSDSLKELRIEGDPTVIGIKYYSGLNKQEYIRYF